MIRVFAYLSLLTVGGGMAAFPEMQELTVNVNALPLKGRPLRERILENAIHPPPHLKAFLDALRGIEQDLCILLELIAPTALEAGRPLEEAVLDDRRACEIEEGENEFKGSLTPDAFFSRMGHVS